MLIHETKTPPLGWNSYDCYAGSINEKQANANLDVFIEKLKPAGFEYFCLDAGWYGDGDQVHHMDMIAHGQFRHMNMDEYGRFIASPVNFPHTLRALADRCHANGLKFGVHMMRGMPLFAVEKNTKIKGTDYHARDIYDPDNFCSWCKYWVATKTDHPGTLAFYKSEVEYLADELNVDFIKLDDATEHPDHIRLFAEAIDSVKRPILFSLSPGNELWERNMKIYEELANMVRIVPDVWDYDETNLIKLQRWYQFENVTPGKCWLDLDMIPLGGLQVTVPLNTNEHFNKELGFARQSRMTPQGKRVMMSIMALSASPLLFGGDLPTTPQSDFDYVLEPEVLKCNQNGVIGKRIFFSHHIDIRKAESKNEPGHGWIGIFSVNQDNRRIRLSPQDLGFEKTPALYDIWNRENIYVDPDGTVELFIPAYGGFFLKY